MDPDGEETLLEAEVAAATIPAVATATTNRPLSANELIKTKSSSRLDMTTTSSSSSGSRRPTSATGNTNSTNGRKSVTPTPPVQPSSQPKPVSINAAATASHLDNERKLKYVVEKIKSKLNTNGNSNQTGGNPKMTTSNDTLNGQRSSSSSNSMRKISLVNDTFNENESNDTYSDAKKRTNSVTNLNNSVNLQTQPAQSSITANSKSKLNFFSTFSI